MSKILLFNIPATGHIHSTLPVVAELVRRGEEVIYYDTEAYRTKIESTGADFRPYPFLRDAEVAQSMTGGNFIELALRIAQATERLIPWVLEEIQREQPTFIIHDTLCLWGACAGRKAGLPRVAVISTFALGNRAPLDPRLVAGQVLGSLSDLLEYRSIYRRIRRRYYLGHGNIDDAFNSTGNMNIAFTSRMFQPNADAFPENFLFVGPCIAPRVDDPDFPFDRITRQPVIYIARGTTLKADLSFYRAAVEAFANHPGQVIIAYGRNNDLSSLEPFPSHFIVRPYVPQFEVLRRADVFITHGGMNSVQEGLLQGVPLVVVPGQVEQAAVAARVRALGAGLTLGMRQPLGQVSADDLRGAVAAVLADDRYRVRAKQIGDSLRQAGGAARAADALQAFGRGEARI